ncbi:MAG: heme exporter protein CcmB [Pseudomonadota bacterium]
MTGSVLSQARALFVRDLKVAARIGGGGLLAVVFFALIVMLIPFALGRDNLPVLASLAPGIVWLGVLLASLLTLDRLFQADFEDGSLDVVLASGFPLTALVLVKCLAHWVLTALPLIAATPVLALLAQLPGASLPGLMLALGVGTPGLSLLGAVGAALTVDVRRGGLLLSLLVLPLMVPILIFGAAAGASGETFGPTHLLLLSASLLGLAIAPPAAAAALRLSAG